MWFLAAEPVLFCNLLSPKLKLMQLKAVSYTHLWKLIVHGAVIHFIFRECPSPTLPGATQFSCCTPVNVLLAHNWKSLSAVYNPFISSQVCSWLNISINKSQSTLITFNNRCAKISRMVTKLPGVRQQRSHPSTHQGSL